MSKLYTEDQFIEIFGSVIADALKRLRELPPVDIIRCKDCAKQDKERGYYPNGKVIHKDEACPLIDFRGRAKGHEFDNQFCCFGERKEQ